MSKNIVSVNSSLNDFVNTEVIVKLVNGRTISGHLKGAVGSYTIKLGTKHIPLDDTTVVRVVALRP
jgi:hypothetical protein